MKTYYGLMIFLALSATCQASANPSSECQDMLQKYDAYVPSVCIPDHTHDWLPGDTVEIKTLPEPKMDWDEARKICANHWISMSFGEKDESIVDYEQKFGVACRAVDTHFDEEAHRKKVAEQIAKNARDQKDLNRLTDFLAGSAAK